MTETEILENTILAILEAGNALLDLPSDKAIMPAPQKSKKKKDSLVLDVVPENILVNSLRRYHNCIVATEESGRIPEIIVPRIIATKDTVFYIIDPLDGSKELKEIIEEANLPTVRDACNYWHKKRPDLYVEGSLSSVTAVRDGAVIFNVMLNLATETLFVAYPEGAFSLPSKQYQSLDELALDGEKIKFRPGKGGFVAFSKKGKGGMPSEYELNMSNVGISPSSLIGVPFQAGPARILYLSDKAEQPGGSAAFVLSNGEKLGEWVGWLAYAYQNPGLRFFKLFPSGGSPYLSLPLREDFLLCPTQPHTIFQGSSIDMDRLSLLDPVNLYRDTVIAVRDECIGHVPNAVQQNWREIRPILGD